jgi:hypothetical protein
MYSPHVRLVDTKYKKRPKPKLSPTAKIAADH